MGELDCLFGVLFVGIDCYIVEGLFDLLYEIEYEYIVYLVVDLLVFVGFWCSVGYLYNGFFMEGFFNDVVVVVKFDLLVMWCDLLKVYLCELKVLDMVV